MSGFMIDGLEQPVKKIQVRKTIYWCVEFDDNQINKILNNATIKFQLDNYTNLVVLKKMHTTLLYLGKHTDENEKIYFDVIGKECTVIIDSFAISGDSLCLNVSSLKFIENNVDVSSFAKKQHVTVALKQHVRAADSTLAFTQGTTINLDSELSLIGIVKRY